MNRRAHAGAGSTDQRHILVVEDDVDLRRTMCALLQHAGYPTWQAANGADAIAILKRSGGLVSLIILDVQMPVMNGLRFRALQAKDPRLARIPIIACSGSDDALYLHACAHLRKPFDAAELLARVRAWAGAPVHGGQDDAGAA